MDINEKITQIFDLPYDANFRSESDWELPEGVFYDENIQTLLVDSGESASKVDRAFLDSDDKRVVNLYGFLFMRSTLSNCETCNRPTLFKSFSIEGEEKHATFCSEDCRDEMLDNYKYPTPDETWFI